MSDMMDPVVALRMREARRFAAYCPDPDHWNAQLDMLDRLSDEGPAAAERLVVLAREYWGMRLEIGRRQLAHATAGGPPVEQPLPLLVSEMVGIVCGLLLAAGASAHGPVLAACSAEEPTSDAQLVFLNLMAESGDAEYETVFRDLRPPSRAIEEGARVWATLLGRYWAARARQELAGAAAQATGEPPLERYVRALGHEREWWRAEAARLLGELGDARAVGPLRGLLNDSSARVRRKAEEALKLLSAGR